MRFVQLYVTGGTPREERTVFDFFVRHHQRVGALVIVTEWNEFRSLDWQRVAQLMKGRVVVDLRNIYQPDHIATEGFAYHSIGRPAAHPAAH